MTERNEAATTDEPDDSYLDWTAALVRILALYWVASGSMMAASTVASLGAITNGALQGRSVGGVLYSAGVATVSTFIVAAILWRGAGRLAGTIWGDRTPAQVPTMFDIRGLQRVVRQGIGLFVVAHAAPSLPSAIAEYLRSGADRGMLSYPYYPMAHLLGVLLQVAIGLWLFVGTRTIAGWLRITREAR